MVSWSNQSRGLRETANAPRACTERSRSSQRVYRIKETVICKNCKKMKIDKQLLDTLSSQAKENPRLRQNYDLRNSENDNSQRMLNALEPGTIMPIHRHRNSSETVVIVRGSLIERFYDENGYVTEEVLMCPGGETPIVNVEKGRWHSLECLEPNTVIFASKDRAWQPLSEEDIMML